MLSEQRWVGGGGKKAVVQGAVSSSQVRPAVEPRPSGPAVSTRGPGQVGPEIFQGARLPETPAPPTSSSGEVTPTVVEGRRRVGAARWRSCRADVATTPPIGDVHRNIMKESCGSGHPTGVGEEVGTQGPAAEAPNQDGIN